MMNDHQCIYLKSRRQSSSVILLRPTKAKSGSLTVLLLVLCALTRAQTTIGQFPPGLVSLTNGWRYSAGDDPGLGQSGF